MPRDPAWSASAIRMCCARRRPASRCRHGSRARGAAGSRRNTACCPAPPTSARGARRRGQAVRPHAGDPAPDRPLAARRRRPAPRSASGRSWSIATCCRPTAAPAPPRSPAPGWRCMTASPGCRRAACSRRSAFAIMSPPSRAASYGGEPVLDLDYAEDSDSRHRREFRDDRVGRHRRGARHRRDAIRSAEEQFDQLMALARQGIAELVALQKLTVA